MAVILGVFVLKEIDPDLCRGYCLAVLYISTLPT